MVKKSKRRILFMAEAVTLSHVVRPLVLAESLDPQKYEVYLACDPRYNSLLGELPFRVIPLKSSIREDNLVEKLSSGGPIFDVATLDAYVQEDMRIIAELSPEIVVGDMRQSLSVSTRLTDTTYVNIVNAQWSPFSQIPFELPRLPLAGLIPQPFAQLITNLAAPLGFAGHIAPLNLVRLKYGLPPIDWNVKQVYSFGDFTIYPDIPELIPTSQLPAHHQYIGPILWSPETPLPEWWEQVPDDKPLVYVNLGSSGRHRLLPVVLTALGQLPVTVIAATASETLLVEVPANAFVCKYLPGAEAARRSRLVICNGGNMSAQQALAEATPVLSIASNLDQMMFARAVCEAGAGEVLREEEVQVAAVKKVVWNMLRGQGYSAAAERIKRLYGQRQATLLFPALIEDIPASG